MSRVLVTGGSGFIGAELVKKLLNKNHEVTVLDNQFRGQLTRLESVLDDIHFIKGDIRDPVVVDKAMRGIDTVYHLAFINGTKYFYEIPDRILEVGLKGTLNVFDSIKKHDVNRLIYASSAEAYQSPAIIPTPEDVPLVVPDVHNPRYSYGGAKLAGELLTFHYLRNTDVETLIFRPHNIYGPNMGWEHVIPDLVCKMKMATLEQKSDEIAINIQGEGKETRAFCFVEDAADGIVIVGEKGGAGNVYHIGTQEEVTIAELARKIAEELDLCVTLKPTALAKGGTLRRCPSIQKITSLGYEPKFNLVNGLKKTCHWYFENAEQLDVSG